MKTILSIWSGRDRDKLVCLLSLCILGLVANSARAQIGLSPEEIKSGWRLLFNGTDTTGWKGDPEFWSIKDNAITMIATEEHWVRDTSIMYLGEDCSDFELQFKCRLIPQEGKRNFEVAFVGFHDHSADPAHYHVVGKTFRLAARTDHMGDFQLRDPDISIPAGIKAVVKNSDDPKKPAFEKLGDLDQSDKIRSPLVFEKWNTYAVVATDANYRFYVNGMLFEDISDQLKDRRKSGSISFSVLNHTHATIQFKDIKLRRLNSVTTAVASSVAPSLVVPQSVSISPSVMTSPRPAVTSEPANKIDDLREHAAAMADIALRPLEGASGANVQGYVTELREDLLDEAARKPTTSQAAYSLGVHFCKSLLAIEDERTTTIARLENNRPSNAAGGAGVKKIHPNWADLVREQAEAAAATHNNTLETSFHKQIKVQWGMRMVELRKLLDSEIADFRQALRQSPPSN